MNQNVLFTLWGVLFIVCAALGFVPAAGSVLQGVMTALSILFFVPPAVLLYRGGRNTALLIRNLSALSLGLTLVFLTLNVIFAVSSEVLGNVLHYALAVISSPMMCSGYWALSLFLWACLLMASLKITKTRT